MQLSKLITLRTFTFLLIVSFFITKPLSSFGQDALAKTANDFYDKHNYKEAIEYYEKVLQTDPDNHEYLFKIGISYLNSNVDKSKAADYLERLYVIDAESHEIWFQLGLAYHHALKLDKALEFFEKYKPFATDDEKSIVDQHIRNCHSAQKLMAHRVNVTFENLGEPINTEFPEYYPFVSKDDSYIAFTSRHKRTSGGYKYEDGYYASDIMVSEKDTSGHFAKPKKAGSRVNSEYDDQCVGLSDDGHTMFVYNNIDKDGNIFKSFRKTSSFGEPETLGDNVNSKSLESAACISHDESVLFFSSNRDGGYGGLDLYMARKLPTGEWAEPQNLGPDINTEFNEDFPTHSADDKTLYFCSEGHENMGGYDIFSADWDSETNTWGIPKNIGYPINSPDDERVISFTEDGHHAYISAVKKGGFGDLDIYKITLHDNLPQAIVMLTLKNTDGTTNFDAFVSVNDEFGDPYGEYMPNPNSGQFLIIVPIGKWELSIDDGANFVIEPLEFSLDEVKENPMVMKEIQLQ